MDEQDETWVDEGEQPADAEPAPESAPAPAPGRHLAENTGHPAVDAVLASLEGLDDKPVHEHVAVFESAHEQLRRALDEAGDEPATGETPAGEQGQG